MMFLVYYTTNIRHTWQFRLVYADSFELACDKINKIYPEANSFQNLTLL